MPRYLPAVLEVVGLILITTAAFVVALPLGLLTAGLSLALLGVALDRLGSRE